jgi:1,4-alpha-glucan branching enzyme
MEVPQLVKEDPYLQPYTSDFVRWADKYRSKEKSLLGEISLLDFASGHDFFGLFKTEKEWIFRDWAPNATRIFLQGSFNGWQDHSDYELYSIGNGSWEVKLPLFSMHHNDLYALSIHWENGSGKRIPAWARRVVQDSETKIFNAQVWAPRETFKFSHNFKPSHEAPLIYESHVGMAGEEPKVHTYNEFRYEMLPRIKAAGYNTIQLMAIPEHPYYGSFGYHVSSFFAPSSRFGTPEELKHLIDEAHGMGMAVVMDLVHSHAVKNVNEGLGLYDGTRTQFFHAGARGEHPAWDSFCFDYSKNEVIHFLLSNIKYWLTEFRFDGFRFDGVTSMLYYDHGLGKAFTSYSDYFTPNLDDDAVVYFMLANKLAHQVNPQVLSIAEEMSGLPGLAAPLASGGLGFDYRMSMGVPDLWIKLIKEQADQDWNVGHLFHELTAHRPEEKVVSYVESHDQAMVGDKTVIFRLIDKEMYFSMRKDQPNLTVDRGIALHKMIRLVTIGCAGGAYLNFMGNEFGHPEWIDFPREGNGWSYQHARRIWSIAEESELKFHWLLDFDKDMIHLFRKERMLEVPEIWRIHDNMPDQVLAFKRKNLLFVFNFNPDKSFEDYGIHCEPAKFKLIFQTDAHIYGGFNRVDDRMTYYSLPESGLGSPHQLKLYLPARTAIVLQQQAYTKVR